MRRARIATLLEHAGHVLQWGQAENAHLEVRQRARLAFEQLGPTFVKLGQMLSTREDLLPPAWTTELARLHSDVAPVLFDDLLPQIEQVAALRSKFLTMLSRTLRRRVNCADTPSQTRQRYASGPEDSASRDRGKDRRLQCRKLKPPRWVDLPSWLPEGTVMMGRQRIDQSQLFYLLPPLDRPELHAGD